MKQKPEFGALNNSLTENNTMNEPQTALTKAEPQQAIPRAEFSAFGNITHFENAQRMAKALCSSAMIPETYRGEQNIGSCLIALEMANRIGANVLSVMQNLYIVHGKPAWSSQFLIACLNSSGRFSPLRYRMTGDKDKDSYGCVAWATDKTGEKLESPEITIGIAKAEGWHQKNGSKWKTMPELMLRYRTATLFARLYAPEISLGMQTDDEVIDIIEVAPVVTSPVFAPKETKAKKATAPQAVVEATVVKPEPVNTPAPPATANVTDAAELGEPVNPEPTFEQVVDSDRPELEALKAALVKHEATELQVIEFCQKRGLLKEASDMQQLSLSSIRSDKIAPLTKQILANGETLKKIKEGK